MNGPRLAIISFIFHLSLAAHLPSAQAISLDNIFEEENGFPAGPKLTSVADDGVPADCTSLELKRKIQKTGFQGVQEFFTRCEKYHPSNGIIGLFKATAFDKVALEKGHRYRPMIFSLSSGDTLRGTLALKDTSEPLPLVIYRGGLYYGADYSFLATKMLLHYFEHAPFHVLLLENPTNKEYVKRNQSVRLGGLATGHQIREVLHSLKRSPYGRRFLEYHLVAASLGAHDALFAADFIERDPNIEIRSLTLLCPAVDLESSLLNLFRSGLIGSTNGSFLKSVVQELWSDVPVLNQVFPYEVQGFSVKEMGEQFVLAAMMQLQKDPFAPTVGSPDEFFEKNNTIPVIERLKTPTYVMQAKNDSITHYAGNMAKILHIKRPNLHAITTDRGEHCGFSDVFGRDLLSTLLSEIVLRHSQLQTKTVTIDARHQMAEQNFLGVPNINPGPGEVIASYEVTGIKGFEAELAIRYFNPNKRVGVPKGFEDECHQFQYWNAPLECLKVHRIKVPAAWVSNIQSTTTLVGNSKQTINSAISRFNALGAILDTDGENIIGREVVPQYLRLPTWIQDSNY